MWAWHHARDQRLSEAFASREGAIEHARANSRSAEIIVGQVVIPDMVVCMPTGAEIVDGMVNKAEGDEAGGMGFAPDHGWLIGIPDYKIERLGEIVRAAIGCWIAENEFEPSWSYLKEPERVTLWES